MKTYIPFVSRCVQAQPVQPFFKIQCLHSMNQSNELPLIQAYPSLNMETKSVYSTPDMD